MVLLKMQWHTKLSLFAYQNIYMYTYHKYIILYRNVFLTEITDHVIVTAESVEKLLGHLNWGTVGSNFDTPKKLLRYLC